jgi:hypothetical protein
VDLGSVIPSVLERADIPDLAALIAPRRLLFCQARDGNISGAEAVISRFRNVTGAGNKQWIEYAPGQPLDGKRLLEWLR